MRRAFITLSVIGGARIGLEMTDEESAELHARIDFAAPDITAAPPMLRYRSATSRDGRRVFERHDVLRGGVQVIGSTMDELADDVHLSIALHATDDVFVHAGVVAWNGRAVVLPGRSLAGKSTLVHELVRAGATYLSDEYARITSSGEIAAYPRPLQLRLAKGRRRLVDPHTIGSVADTPCVPGLVVFTHHRAGGAFEPVAVPPAQAALELYDNTVIAEIAPERALRAVAHVARAARSVRSDRGESAATVALIRSLVDAEVAA